MDYEKKYKDALERAKDCHVNKKFSELDDNAQELCEYIFPELKESEDKQSKEWILEYLYDGLQKSDEQFKGQFKAAIAWLEKQAEPQPYKGNADTMRKNLIKAFKSIGSKHWGGFDVRDIIHFLESKNAIELEKQGEKHIDEKLSNLLNRVICRFINDPYIPYSERDEVSNKIIPYVEQLEKQGKQKSADKVELKFHEGEWLCENEPNNYARFIQILETVNVQGKEGYRISRDIHNYEDIVEFDFVEKYYHKFDIKDARNGDVLVTKEDNRPFIFKGLLDSNNPNCPVAYCGIDSVNLFLISSGNHWWSDEEVCPATKEQRELLFNKMKEAGYKWDADKKTLVMIGINNDEEDEQYEELMEDNETSIKQKPAWSEDDELKLKQAIYICHQNGYTDVENWLKSIKPQPHWKPTEEQMEDLKYAINMVDKCCEDSLQSLYDELKKL